MSDRTTSVLLSEIRTARQRAMRRKGLKDSDQIAQSVYADIEYLRGAENNKRVWVFYIKQMARLDSATRAARSKGDIEHQLHFHYWDDLETPLPIERYGRDESGHRKFLGTELVELGDFRLAEIKARSDQIEENSKRISIAKATWRRAVVVIGPLLKAHPEWRWRDAVEYLRRRDELPALPRA